MSREGALVLNNMLLCSIAAVVLTGTTYPLFADLLLGEKLSVGPPFFNATVFPLAAPLFAAMAVGPLLAWKRADLLAALAKAVVGGAGCRGGGRFRRSPAHGCCRRSPSPAPHG